MVAQNDNDHDVAPVVEGDAETAASQVSDAEEEQVRVESTTTKSRETVSKQPVEAEPEIAAGSLSAPGESSDRSGRHVKSGDAQPIQSIVAPHAAATSNQRIQQNLIPRTSDSGAGRVPLDSAKFLPRVAKAFAAAAERGGEIRIRLSPPELGSIRLEVKMQGGNMTAKLDAETPAARQALLDNLPLLRERLAEQGLRIEQLDIGSLDRQDRETFDAEEQEQHHSQNSKAEEEKRSESERERTAPVRRGESTSLDVVA